MAIALFRGFQGCNVLRMTRRLPITLALLPLLLLPAIASGQGLFAPDPNQPPQAEPAQEADAPASQLAQENGSQTDASHTQPGQTQDDKKQKQKKEGNEGPSEGKQTKRMLYVVPNFAAVSAYKQLPPLSVSAKFRLATSDSFDYSSFVWTGIVAAQDYGLDSYPELGSGFVGYSRYYWRGFIDGVSGTYFTEAIVPALSHEDPRYYTQEGGGFWHRMGYALSRTVITMRDTGGNTFNFSEVGGNLCEAALSEAYYPAQERGVGKTFENWGTQMESAALNNIAKEFWPDFRRIVLRRQDTESPAP